MGSDRARIGAWCGALLAKQLLAAAAEFLARPMAILPRPIDQELPWHARSKMNHLRFLGFVAAATVSGLLIAQDIKPQEPVKDQAAAGAPRTAVPNPATGGNSWFPVTTQDLGTFFGSGDASGIFKFKNPTDKEIAWRNLAGSCQCAKATIRVGGRVYELTSKPTPNQLLRVTKVPGQPDQTERVQQIAIEAHAEGEVEVHLDMNGITGPKQASLDIHTTDEAVSQLKLNFHANGAQLFMVTPTDVNLNKMTWNESREFTVTVTSPMHKDWEITRMDEAKGFQVTWEKSVANDQTTWTVKGKYGPVDGETAGGGMLKLYTNVRGESSFSIRVQAMVVGPIEVKPGGFMTLGLVRRGTGLKKEVVFEPNDGVNLEAVSLTFEKVTMAAEFVSAKWRKDGAKLVVELEVSEKAPAGLLKGDLVVQLNHPLVKERRIMFYGFVR